MGTEGKQLLSIRCLMCQGFSGTWEPSTNPLRPQHRLNGVASAGSHQRLA